MRTLEELRADKAAAIAALKAFEDGLKDAAGNPRGMTAEELVSHGKLCDAIEAKEKEVAAKERSDRLSAGAAADPSRPVPAAAKGKEVGPFKSFGEQLQAIAQVSMNHDKTGQTDTRLKYGMIKAAGANETIASEGGFLVQEDFSTKLLNLVHETGSIISRVTNIPISSNSNALKLPTIDETSRARGSRWGGVRAYWLAEAEQKVDSKPAFGEISLGLNKLAALGYATDELLQDTTAMESIFSRAFTEEIRFEVEDSIFNGNGAGKPLGILKSGAVVSIAKETSQAAATVNFYNLVKMLERLPTRSRRNAVWVVNDSGLETALYSIVIPGTQIPIFLPPGQNDKAGGNSIYGTLFGRPIIPVEYLPATGTVGDIMLVDLSEYLTIDKGGIQTAESMHVRFIYDEMCFRLVYRIDGKPAWRKPVTTANGAMAKSPFVSLATRS